MKNFKIYFYWFLDFIFFTAYFIEDEEADEIIKKIKKIKMKDERHLELKENLIVPTANGTKKMGKTRYLITREGFVYLTIFRNRNDKKYKTFKLKKRLELHKIIKEKKTILNHCKRRF